MKYTIIFALALFLFPRTVVAQNCYVRLTDASGYTPAAEQIAALEQAAAALCAVFDSAGFGGQFKVYDFGFYLHNEKMIGEYPEMFQSAIMQVETQCQYYLLFGKQTESTGIYRLCCMNQPAEPASPNPIKGQATFTAIGAAI